MPIENGDFSDGFEGKPSIWTLFTPSILVIFAEFNEINHDRGYEGFLFGGWVSPDFVYLYEGFYVDIDPATYGSTLLTYESFETEWGAYTLYQSLNSIFAIFDPNSNDFEDFEDGWGDYWYILPTVVYAIFDSSLTPQDFEDFEDGFGLGTQQLKGSFSPVDISYAQFDNGGAGTDPYESFDGTWSTLTL